MKRKIIALLAAMLVLALCASAALAEEQVTYELGDVVEDFTFTTYDGKEYTLSEVLKEKDMVLLNLWATWCGPCRREFPFMTEAYEEYKDRIEIFALSTEEDDTNEVLAEYVANNGMTFPVGRDTVGLGKAFYTGYIPNTIVIDRNGVVCYHEYGSLTDSDSFRRIFDLYVGDDYEGPVLQVGVPLKVPDVEPTDPEALAALNAEGGELVFSNPEDEYNWPVVLVEKDGRTAAETTSLAAANGTSAVNVTVNAKQGDVLTFEYKCSTEADYDFAVYAVNGGDFVNLGSGETDWQTGRVSFPADGEYVVTLGYTKDGASDDGEDKVWFANVALIPADDVVYELGDYIRDFSFTTYDGTEYTLSEILEEKEMVLLNLWATWCGPCKREFPFMTEAYEEYKDKIEVIALSTEEDDTNEILADYVAQNGMTFLVGRDTAGLRKAFYTGYIPNTVVIDRNGVVCYHEYGSLTDSDSFRRIFDLYVGDEYTEPVLQVGVPLKVPDVEPTDPEALAALNAEGGELVFSNPEDEYNWPVVLVEKDGRTAAETTSLAAANGTSAVNVTVNAKQGDVLTFEYKCSTEADYDFAVYAINGGDFVQIGSGETDWQTGRVSFPADGEYVVTLGYTKDGASDDGEDKVWFANVALIPGDEVVYEVGDYIRDFSFTTYDGTEYTLSEVLKEKDMVLINVWATWCGPCRAEFPYMEQDYQKYKDDVEIFALSCEEEDTNEVIADFVKEMGMTFPTGRDTPNMMAAFNVTGIPTSIAVDRFGKVCCIVVGSQAEGAFERLFDTFVGDEYTESVYLDDIPPFKPDVEPVDPEALAVLNAEGGELVFSNPEDEYTWPVALVEKDGKTVAESTNAGTIESSSLVNVAVTAQEGDVLTFDYKTSTEAGYDFLLAYLNGEKVPVDSGEKDWTTAIVPFPAAGEYTVSIGYKKDGASDVGEDKVWFGNVKVLTGDEAAAAVASLPVYPVSDAVTLNIMNEGTKEIVFIDSASGEQIDMFGAPAYIVPGDEVQFTATLTEKYSPVGAAAQTTDGATYMLSDILVDGVYAFTATFSSAYDYAALYPDSGAYDDMQSLYFFNTEADVDAFLVSYFGDEDGNVPYGWAYADGSAKAE